MADVFTKAKRSDQKPKSFGVRPACRMMERVVPMGSSFFGWGTMALRPVALRYLVWLPFWETKTKPCCSSTRMTSADPSRLGIHQLLPHVEVGHEGVGGIGFAFEVKFDSFFQVGHGLFAGGTETRNVHVETLADKEFVLAVNNVGHLFHWLNLAETSTG